MHFISENTRKCNFLSALCALLIFGTVIQIYVFTSNIVLVTDRMSIRFVTNNEFIPLWASLASFPIFWCTTYILVKACYWQPLTSSTNSSKINWFPVNPRVQVVLWLTYALLMFSLGVSTSVLFFRLYIRTKFVLSILAYAIPILVSILATPLLAKALRNPSPQNHESDQNSDKQHSAANNKINAIAYTSPDYLKHINSPGNLSIQSKISQGTKISGNTECSYVPFSPTSELDTQALTNSALTLKQISDLHHNIDNRCSLDRKLLKALFTLATYGPLAVVASFVSIAIYALLFYNVFDQYRHLVAAPNALPTLALSSTTYDDSIEHQVKISIMCKGALPPELAIPSASGLPQGATILIEHMSGFPSLIVRSIQDALVEQNHRVCIYDRPGFMLSPQGYAPISPKAMEEALGDALANINEHGPYYVIGHHSGSEYAHIFARTNRLSVVGMSFLYPTASALLGLLSDGIDFAKRKKISSGMVGDSMIAESTSTLASLNLQRMLAAIGIWANGFSTEVYPTVGTKSGNNAALTWALDNPSMVQAQYYELLRRQSTIQILEEVTNSTSVVFSKELPVILFGVDPTNANQRIFLESADSRYKLEISDANESQPLRLSQVARQISWHIARIN